MSLRGLGFLVAVCCFGLPIHAAGVCDTGNLEGAYGFQLSGRTNISGESKSVVSLGRIVFDGQGTLAGSSSVMFAGYLLGNPVTGQSEVHGDCTVTWSVQDDSGAYQHFSGVMTADRKSIRFRQIDEGGSLNGVMVRSQERCSSADLRKRYDFTLSGSFTPMSPGDTADTIDEKGVFQSDDSGQFTLSLNRKPPITSSVTIKVDDDCVVNLEWVLPYGSTVSLRGTLVNEGSEILAIRTNPGWMAAAKFTAP